MNPKYKIEVLLYDSNVIQASKPYFWCLKSRLENDWCTEQAGWAESPEIAFSKAYDFYTKYKAEKTLLESEETRLKIRNFEDEKDAIYEGIDYEKTHTSPEFRCERTKGYPTTLCFSFEKGKAWLRINEWMAGFDQDLTPYHLACAEFGVRDCNSVEDFNALLEELGDDVLNTARMSEEDMEQCEDIGMGGIQ